MAGSFHKGIFAMDLIKELAPYLELSSQSKDSGEQGAQIDLIIDRTDQ